jgi:hypothetical protein
VVRLLSPLGILDGIDAAAAHSVWELVLHLTAWTRETARRVQGGSHGAPTEGDWPEVAGSGEFAWDAAVAGLRRAQDDLVRILVQVGDGQLDRQVGGSQVDAHGHAVTIHRTVIGLLQHDAYHAG